MKLALMAWADDRAAKLLIDERLGAIRGGEEEVKAGGTRVRCTRIDLGFQPVRVRFWIDPLTAFVWKYEAGAVTVVFRKLATSAVEESFTIPPKFLRVESRR